jgi:hypothetical protein
MAEARNSLDDLLFQDVCMLLSKVQEIRGEKAKDRRRKLLERFHKKFIPPGRCNQHSSTCPFQRVASGCFPSSFHPSLFAPR